MTGCYSGVLLRVGFSGVGVAVSSFPWFPFAFWVGWSSGRLVKRPRVLYDPPRWCCLVFGVQCSGSWGEISLQSPLLTSVGRSPRWRETYRGLGGIGLESLLEFFVFFGDGFRSVWGISRNTHPSAISLSLRREVWGNLFKILAKVFVLFGDGFRSL